jgi:hypothetical protein
MSELADRIRAYVAEHPDRSRREVAEAIGCAYATVVKALNPAAATEWNRQDNARRREAKRAFGNKYNRRPDVRGSCERCGGLMGIGRNRQGGTCAACRTAAKEANWERIEVMWAAGLLMREIADQMGWSLDRMRCEIDRMRKSGRAVPYRYRACDARTKEAA